MIPHRIERIQDRKDRTFSARKTSPNSPPEAREVPEPLVRPTLLLDSSYKAAPIQIQINLQPGIPSSNGDEKYEKPSDFKEDDDIDGHQSFTSASDEAGRSF